MSEDRWMPIESAPKDGTQVMLWKAAEPRTIYTARWIHSEVMGPVWATPDMHVLFGFTHWQPLPEPPEES